MNKSTRKGISKETKAVLDFAAENHIDATSIARAGVIAGREEGYAPISQFISRDSYQDSLGIILSDKEWAKVQKTNCNTNAYENALVMVIESLPPKGNEFDNWYERNARLAFHATMLDAGLDEVLWLIWLHPKKLLGLDHQMTKDEWTTWIAALPDGARERMQFAYYKLSYIMQNNPERLPLVADSEVFKYLISEKKEA